MERHQIQEIFRGQNLSIALITLCSVGAGTIRSSSATTCFGRIEPRWIVVRKPQKSFVVNLQSELMSIAELCEMVPELNEFLHIPSRHRGWQ